MDLNFVPLIKIGQVEKKDKVPIPKLSNCFLKDSIDFQHRKSKCFYLWYVLGSVDNCLNVHTLVWIPNLEFKS